MAHKVKLAKNKTFEFKSRAVGGTVKYPWDEWFDGNLYLLERHTDGAENEKGTIETPTEEGKRDFGVSVNAMVPKLHTAARRRYKVVQISRENEHGHRIKGGLIIQARDMTEEERAAEDALRAEEKEAAKLRRAEASAEGRQPEPEQGDDTVEGEQDAA
jgi:hypothetical protein